MSGLFAVQGWLTVIRSAMLCGSSTPVAMQCLATTKQLYTPFADTPERYSIAIPGTTSWNHLYYHSAGIQLHQP